jgi:hypothetical protein
MLFTLLYFVSSILTAQKTPLSVDEVFVMWIVHYFPGAHVVDALKMGLDSLPPGYYWLVSGFTAVLGQTSLAIRLPSILGFFVFALSVLYILQRRVPWHVAVSAVFFTCVTGAAYSSTVARPYALVVAAFGVSAAAWLDLPSSRRTGLRCGIIAVAVAIALSVHFLAIYLVAVLSLAELIRGWRDRRVQWRYWLSLLAGTATLLIWLPVIGPIFKMTHASVHAPGYYARPTFFRLIGSSISISLGTGMELIEIAMVLLVFIVPILAGHARSPEFDPTGKLPIGAVPGFRDIYILVLAAFALPLIAFVASVLVIGTFNERYFLGVALGVVLLMASGQAHARGGVVLSIVLTLASASYFVRMSFAKPEDHPLVALTRCMPERLPVIVPSASDIYILSEALPAELQHQISFVGVPPGLQSPDPEPELIARNWKAAVPAMSIYTWQQWSQKSKAFYLIDNLDGREGLADWLIAHERVRVAAHLGQYRLLRVDLVGP